MAHLFIFGLGYSAKRIADMACRAGWTLAATGADGTVDFGDLEAVRRGLSGADYVLSSVPPDRVSGQDPVLAAHGPALPPCPLGYLSSTGTYGDQKGAWVDESAPTSGTRRMARAKADAAWLERGAHVFRLPGIYGPGRSALDRVREGKAHRIDLPEQVFSRVHVTDIATGVMAAISGAAPPGAYNLADDLPCSQNLVIEEACRLMHVDPPPLLTLEQADLSPMARGFYAENRRVANGKAKRVLGWRPAFATYREGLASLL